MTTTSPRRHLRIAGALAPLAFAAPLAPASAHAAATSATCSVRFTLTISPGTVGLDETYDRGDCLAHVGTGTARITLPTSGGPQHMAGAATSRRPGLGLRAEVRFPGARFSGAGVAVPLQGTCALTPLRRALIAVSGSLRGA